MQTLEYAIYATDQSTNSIRFGKRKTPVRARISNSRKRLRQVGEISRTMRKRRFAELTLPNGESRAFEITKDPVDITLFEVYNTLAYECVYEQSQQIPNNPIRAVSGHEPNYGQPLRRLGI